jgi:membrane protease YdiL (CAAX protease family)
LTALDAPDAPDAPNAPDASEGASSETRPDAGPGLPALLGAWALVTAVAAAGRLWFPSWSAAVAALVMLLLPILLGRDMARLFRLEARRDVPGALEGLVAVAALIPLFFAGIWLFWRFNCGDVIAGDFARNALEQVGLIAVPEEFFFRAFLQAGLESRWAPRRRARPRVVGVRSYKGLVAASALFALAHLLATGRPAALLVFFPALVFGWLWSRRASLTGPVIFHAACNLSLLWVAPGVF